MTPAKNKTIYVSLRTWGRFFWPFVDVEGGLPPVRAESVINNNSSQTSRTSESIFLPGESTSPVRLEVLRVLGLRPFILHNCDWLENSKPICKHRSSNAAALHDHNCFEICYLHILVDDLQYHMKCRISLVTSMQVPQDHIELPWPRFPIWKIRTYNSIGTTFKTLCAKTTEVLYFDGEVLCLYANQHSCNYQHKRTLRNVMLCDRCRLVFVDIMFRSRASCQLE